MLRGYFIMMTLCIILAIQANAQYHYIPDNGSSLLLLKEKGDLKFSASMPLQSKFGLQAGFSPFNKLSGTLSYFKHSEDKQSFNKSTSGKVYSASIGTYGFFNPKKITNQDRSPDTIEMLWDTYIGYSGGRIDNIYSNAGASNLSYKKWFFQMGLHMSNRYFGISYVVKVSSLDYKEGEVSGSLGTEVQVIYDYILENEPYYIWESDLRMQFGLPLLNTYVGISMINPNNIDKQVAGEMNLYFNAGLVLNLSKLY